MKIQKSNNKTPTTINQPTNNQKPTKISKQQNLLQYYLKGMALLPARLYYLYETKLSGPIMFIVRRRGRTHDAF